MTTATITEEAPRASILAKTTPVSDVPVVQGEPDKVAAAETTSAEPAKQDAAAVKTEVKLTLPEKAPIGEADLKEITDLANSKGLSQDAAQALLDREINKAKTRASEEVVSRNKLYDDWNKQVESDTDFGGNKLDRTVDNAKRALAKYADPEFIKELKESPFGSHPKLLRMLSRMGETLREDTLVTGKPPTSDNSIPINQKLFPSYY